MSNEADAKAKAARETFVQIISDTINEYHVAGPDGHEIASELITCIAAIVEKSTKPNIHRIVVCYSLSQKFEKQIRDLIEQCIKE